MHFKDFITRQRLVIALTGLAISAIALLAAADSQYPNVRGAIYVDISVSAITVVFTALVIDYLGIREEHERTKGVAGLAEDELASTCFRTEWAMARMFGMKPRALGREHMSSPADVRAYVDEIRSEVSEYLETISDAADSPVISMAMLTTYISRLEVSRTELEQTLLLYESAMVYSLRERVLALRSELQVADNILGLIDTTTELNEANTALVRVLSDSVHDAIKEVLKHSSRTDARTTLHAKYSQTEA